MKQPPKEKGQLGIANFFGKKPAKPTPPAATHAELDVEAATKSPNENASPAPAAGQAAVHPSASKRKPAEATDEAAPGSNGAQKLKRLRKAADGAPPARTAAAAAANDLEDDIAAEPASSLARDSAHAAAAAGAAEEAAAAPASGGKASLQVDEVQAAAVEQAIAEEQEREDAEEEEEESGLSSPSGSEGEEEVAGPPKAAKGKKRAGPTKKSIKLAAKVDGVGTGAIAAAAEHRSFDLSKLATWGEGKPVPFEFLKDTFELIAESPKRLVITRHLINAFRAIIATTPADLLPAVYLCTNQVAPSHAGTELGLGDATLIKALAQATGRKEDVIKAEYSESGDLGLVAAKSRAAQRAMFQPAPLTVQGVFKAFRDISAMQGNKSSDRKRAAIVKLLAAAKREEAGYVMRALQGKLRIGLAEQTVLVALAHSAVLQREADTERGTNELAGRLERAAQIVKQVYSECPSYDELVPALLAHPIDELPQHVHFIPGVPVKPMLAKPTTGVSEVLDKFTDQEFTCEWKYDGERAQIHVLDDGTVKIYSRNSEDNTGKYPDIAALVPGRLKPGISSVVLDAEAVAWDREAHKVLPFQKLSTRSRKDVTLENIKVQVCVFAFDCLSINGRTLLQAPLTERREALYSALEPAPGKLEFATAKTSRDIEELTRFLDESVEAGTEGLIVKTMDDSYEPSKRSSHWLKLKKDYLEGVGDTFDLVPIGAWHGRGKRTGVFGSYLLAAYDPENEEYQTISKIGTGFSEEQLKELAEQMRGLVIPAPKSYYRYSEVPNLVPDLWFDAKAVWEVKAADMSISPVHKAALGQVDPAKGISIRFPRLVRVRDDKSAEDATSAEQVAEMYRNQSVLQQKQKGAAAADDD